MSACFGHAIGSRFPLLLLAAAMLAPAPARRCLTQTGRLEKRTFLKLTAKTRHWTTARLTDKLILLKKFARKVGNLKQSPEHYRAARSHKREVDHVPAYSYSNRWVRVGGTCSDERVVIGEIRGSQGNRNYRPGAVRLAQRSRNESVPAAGT